MELGRLLELKHRLVGVNANDLYPGGENLRECLEPLKEIFLRGKASQTSAALRQRIENFTDGQSSFFTVAKKAVSLGDKVSADLDVHNMLLFVEEGFRLKSLHFAKRLLLLKQADHVLR